MLGKIKYYNSERGFGFIIPDDPNESEDLFFHVRNTSGREPQKGDEVSYDVMEGRRGAEGCDVVVTRSANPES